MKPLSLILAACQYPGGLFDRTRSPASRSAGHPSGDGQAPGPADHALERLAEVLGERRDVPLLLTGDQIYIDATAGLFDPTAHDGAYHEAHIRRGNNPRWLAVAGRLIDVLMDDHEVADNWEPSNHGRRNAELRRSMDIGRTAFVEFHRATQTPTPPRGDSPHPLWYAGALGGYPFFFGDTRSERCARCPLSLDRSRIMSEAQFDALCESLEVAQKQSDDRHKFVATPSMLLPRRMASAEHAIAALRSDAWDGYPASLHALLAFICRQGIRNCVFLSGDEHLGCVATIEVQSGSRKATLWSVHTAALYAPYPFANSIAEDFAAPQDSFAFTHDGAPYECRVVTWFAHIGDGFAELQLAADASGAPRLGVSYFDARKNVPNATWPG